MVPLSPETFNLSDIGCTYRVTEKHTMTTANIVLSAVATVGVVCFAVGLFMMVMWRGAGVKCWSYCKRLPFWR